MSWSKTVGDKPYTPYTHQNSSPIIAIGVKCKTVEEGNKKVQHYFNLVNQAEMHQKKSETAFAEAAQAKREAGSLAKQEEEVDDEIAALQRQLAEAKRERAEAKRERAEQTNQVAKKTLPQSPKKKSSWKFWQKDKPSSSNPIKA